MSNHAGRHPAIGQQATLVFWIKTVIL